MRHCSASKAMTTASEFATAALKASTSPSDVTPSMLRFGSGLRERNTLSRSLSRVEQSSSLSQAIEERRDAPRGLLFGGGEAGGVCLVFALCGGKRRREGPHANDRDTAACSSPSPQSSVA